VGLSRPRESTFRGLPLDDELAARQTKPICGLILIDLARGVVLEWLQLEGTVEELYDVLVLPGVCRPKALGLKHDDIRHNVWFADGDTITSWSANSPKP